MIVCLGWGDSGFMGLNKYNLEEGTSLRQKIQNEEYKIWYKGEYFFRLRGKYNKLIL